LWGHTPEGNTNTTTTKEPAMNAWTIKQETTTLETCDLNGDAWRAGTRHAFLLQVHNIPGVRYRVVVGADADNGEVTYEGLSILAAVDAYRVSR
jgi:hypothetical protein